MAFTDRDKRFSIFLNGPRLVDDIESEREESELQCLLFFRALAPCGELQMMKAIRVEHDVSSEIRIAYHALLLK